MPPTPVSSCWAYPNLRWKSGSRKSSTCWAQSGSTWDPSYSQCQMRSCTPLLFQIRRLAPVREHSTPPAVRIHNRETVEIVLLRRELDATTRLRKVMKNRDFPARVPARITPILRQHFRRNPKAKLHIERRMVAERFSKGLPPESG